MSGSANEEGAYDHGSRSRTPTLQGSSPEETRSDPIRLSATRTPTASVEKDHQKLWLIIWRSDALRIRISTLMLFVGLMAIVWGLVLTVQGWV